MQKKPSTLVLVHWCRRGYSCLL